jgi:hypothetical protein
MKKEDGKNIIKTFVFVASLSREIQNNCLNFVWKNRDKIKI